VEEAEGGIEACVYNVGADWKTEGLFIVVVGRALVIVDWYDCVWTFGGGGGDMRGTVGLFIVDDTAVLNRADEYRYDDEEGKTDE
jgi:hypothetical protein